MGRTPHKMPPRFEMTADRVAQEELADVNSVGQSVPYGAQMACGP